MLFARLASSIALASLPACAFGAAALAASAKLPIKAGHYYFDSADDCDSPAELTWDGKRFLSDYVYIDAITGIKKTGDNTFVVTSRTKQRDENTKAQGAVWLAEIKIVDAKKFEFNQHSQKDKANPKDARVYSLCGK